MDLSLLFSRIWKHKPRFVCLTLEVTQLGSSFDNKPFVNILDICGIVEITQTGKACANKIVLEWVNFLFVFSSSCLLSPANYMFQH